MSGNLFLKLWYKIFNKEKYQDYKYKKNLYKRVEYYNSKIYDKILEIEKNIENNQELTFLHSGHLGDIVYSMPVIKELSKKHKCKLYIQVNKPMIVDYQNHPSGKVFLDKRIVNLALPLFRNQNFLSSVDIYNNEKIHINLDLFRDVPINIRFHSTRWYTHITGTHFDINDSFLFVNEHASIKNKIVIVRSPRYRNDYINYKFLKNEKNLLCVGLKSEFEDLKKDIHNLEFYECKDFLEMAQIIKASKFFIGNLCFAYSIAEALKIPRLLETSPDFPVVFPVGSNAYDFYHQNHFEKFFNNLNKS
tara:strand:+ start:2376 stop:3290 length:915 start_codon:yes stop_codon:yes gene_type:complete